MSVHISNINQENSKDISTMIRLAVDSVAGRNIETICFEREAEDVLGGICYAATVVLEDEDEG